MDDNIIYLTNEDGEEIPFEMLDIINFEGNEYAVMMTLEATDDEDAGIDIFKMENIENSCEVSLTTLEDEKTAEKIFNIFVEEHPDEFDYSEE